MKAISVSERMQERTVKCYQPVVANELLMCGYTVVVSDCLLSRCNWWSNFLLLVQRLLIKNGFF